MSTWVSADLREPTHFIVCPKCKQRILFAAEELLERKAKGQSTSTPCRHDDYHPPWPPEPWSELNSPKPVSRPMPATPNPEPEAPSETNAPTAEVPIPEAPPAAPLNPSIEERLARALLNLETRISELEHKGAAPAVPPIAAPVAPPAIAEVPAAVPAPVPAPAAPAPAAPAKADPPAAPASPAITADDMQGAESRMKGYVDVAFKDLESRLRKLEQKAREHSWT